MFIEALTHYIARSKLQILFYLQGKTLKPNFYLIELILTGAEVSEWTNKLHSMNKISSNMHLWV